MLIDSSGTIVDREMRLTHAIGHLELEHRGDKFDTKEEHQADCWAARKLIELESLADALMWNGWQVGLQTAIDLRVDMRTLTTRLYRPNLHPSEIAYLIRRRALQEDAA